jgi:hypothetical protein
VFHLIFLLCLDATSFDRCSATTADLAFMNERSITTAEECLSQGQSALEATGMLNPRAFPRHYGKVICYSDRGFRKDLLVSYE